jgi:hypothetical protein
MKEGNTINGILVTLEVAGEQTLYVMLGVDGTIHRMGSGSEHNLDLDLFIGKSWIDEFQRLSKLTTSVFPQWAGGRVDPQLQGKRCRLTIRLRLDGGGEVFSGWEYGTNSQGPPPEVCEFVRATVDITNEWVEEQKRRIVR